MRWSPRFRAPRVNRNVRLCRYDNRSNKTICDARQLCERFDCGQQLSNCDHYFVLRQRVVADGRPRDVSRYFCPAHKPEL